MAIPSKSEKELNIVFADNDDHFNVSSDRKDHQFLNPNSSIVQKKNSKNDKELSRLSIKNKETPKNKRKSNWENQEVML